MATSVPAPIAAPRSATPTAGASFTPSRTIATCFPAAWSSVIFADLSSGRTLAIKAGTTAVGGAARVVEGAERDAVYERVVAKYGIQVKITRGLAKLGGWINRKPFPYADRGVVVTLDA